MPSILGPSWRHRGRWDKRKRLSKGKDLKAPRLPIAPHHIDALVLIKEFAERANQGITVPEFDARSKNGAVDRYELRQHGLIVTFEGNGLQRLALSPKAIAIVDQHEKILEAKGNLIPDED